MVLLLFERRRRKFLHPTRVLPLENAISGSETVPNLVWNENLGGNFSRIWCRWGGISGVEFSRGGCRWGGIIPPDLEIPTQLGGWLKTLPTTKELMKYGGPIHRHVRAFTVQNSANIPS